jgi:hypothetical protein
MLQTHLSCHCSQVASGLPVMMVNGLMVFDTPPLTGNWFSALFEFSTPNLMITFGSRLKGRACTKHRVRSLIVWIKRSTLGTWSSASVMLVGVGSRSFVRQENSRSPCILATSMPLVGCMCITFFTSASSVFLDRRFGICHTVRNLIHSNIVCR